MIAALSDTAFSETSVVQSRQRGPLSARCARRLARSEGYLHAASRKFLEGTSFHSPVEAVESGEKSVLEWCDCLALARLEYRVNAHLYGEAGHS